MKSALLAVVLVWGSAVYGGEGACTIDAEKFCSGFNPGGTQVRKCLKDHVHELSPDCKDFHASKAKEVFKNVKKADKKGASGK